MADLNASQCGSAATQAARTFRSARRCEPVAKKFLFAGARLERADREVRAPGALKS